MGEITNAEKALVGKLERKRKLGKHSRRWEYISIGIVEI
jgi:hypothetical protein